MNILIKILSFFFIIFLSSCADIGKYKSKPLNEKKYFTSKGFALVYEDSFFKNKTISKKIKNDKIVVLHSFLKKNTPVKKINPENSSFIETKIYSTAKFPSIFTIVISKKVSDDLDLNIDNPYIELHEMKVNKKFVAKESNIFDEEKNVADKAPVTEIQIDNLSDKETTISKEIKKYKYFIIVSDFYYLSTANELKKRLDKKNKN